MSHGPTALEHDLAIIGTECAYPAGAANEPGAIGTRRLRPAAPAARPQSRSGWNCRWTPRRRPSTATPARTFRTAMPFGYHARETYRDVRDGDIGGYAVRRDLESLVAAFADAGIRWPATLVAVVDGLRLWQWAGSRGLPRCFAGFAPSAAKDLDAHDAGADAGAAAVIEALGGDLCARPRGDTPPRAAPGAGAKDLMRAGRPGGRSGLAARGTPDPPERARTRFQHARERRPDTRMTATSLNTGTLPDITGSTGRRTSTRARSADPGAHRVRDGRPDGAAHRVAARDVAARGPPLVERPGSWRGPIRQLAGCGSSRC